MCCLSEAVAWDLIRLLCIVYLAIALGSVMLNDRLDVSGLVSTIVRVPYHRGRNFWRMYLRRFDVYMNSPQLPKLHDIISRSDSGFI